MCSSRTPAQPSPAHLLLGPPPPSLNDAGSVRLGELPLSEAHIRGRSEWAHLKGVFWHML